MTQNKNNKNQNPTFRKANLLDIRLPRSLAVFLLIGFGLFLVFALLSSGGSPISGHLLNLFGSQGSDFQIQAAGNNSIPSVPNLLSPVNNSNVSDSTPDLNWSDSTDGDGDSLKYLIQLTNATDFSEYNSSDSFTSTGKVDSSTNVTQNTNPGNITSSESGGNTYTFDSTAEGFTRLQDGSLSVIEWSSDQQRVNWSIDTKSDQAEIFGIYLDPLTDSSASFSVTAQFQVTSAGNGATSFPLFLDNNGTDPSVDNNVFYIWTTYASRSGLYSVRSNFKDSGGSNHLSSTAVISAGTTYYVRLAFDPTQASEMSVELRSDTVWGADDGNRILFTTLDEGSGFTFNRLAVSHDVSDRTFATSVGWTDEITANIGTVNYSATGNLFTTNITPTGTFASWGMLELDKTEPAGANITVTLLNSSNNASIAGYADILNSSISFSSVNTTLYPSLRLQFDFQSDSTVTATLNSWNLSWAPYVSDADVSNYTTPALNVDETYYWRVRAADNSTAVNAQSGWSPIFQFTPRNTAPTIPSVSSPANNSSSMNFTTTMQWANSTDDDGDNLTYFVQISNSSDFSSLQFTENYTMVNDTEVNTSALSPSTTYYWRVRSKDSSGSSATEFSAWSSVFQFTTKGQHCSGRYTSGRWTIRSRIACTIASNFPITGLMEVKRGGQFDLGDGDLTARQGIRVESGGRFNITRTNLTVTDNLIVDDGGTLEWRDSQDSVWLNGNTSINGSTVWDNVTVHVNSTYDGEFHIIVHSNGTLNMTNSTLTLGDNSSANYYVEIRPGGVLNMLGSSIKNAGFNESFRGLLIQSNNVTIQGSNFTNNYVGIYANSTSFSINNSVIQNSTNQSFYLGGDSNLTLYNTTFNQSALGFNSSASLLSVYWYFQVNVTASSTGGALINSDVNITNVSGGSAANGATDSTGLTALFALLDFTETSNGRVSSNNYTINVSSSGYDLSSSTRNITTSELITVSLSATPTSASTPSTSSASSGGGGGGLAPTGQLPLYITVVPQSVTVEVQEFLTSSSFTAIVQNEGQISGRGVSLFIEGLPDGVTYSVEPKLVDISSGGRESFHVSLSVQPDTVIGAYSMVIKASTPLHILASADTRLVIKAPSDKPSKQVRLWSDLFPDPVFDDEQTPVRELSYTALAGVVLVLLFVVLGYYRRGALVWLKKR